MGKQAEWWELTEGQHAGTAHTLVASSNYMRYSIDTPEGQAITSGTALSVLLGGHWIAGVVEHSGSSYYFRAHDGTTCGLVVGMTVRLDQGRTNTNGNV